MNDPEYEKQRMEWLAAGINSGIELGLQSTERGELFQYGMTLGLHAATSPELVDLSQERLGNLYRAFSKSHSL